MFNHFGGATAVTAALASSVALISGCERSTGGSAVQVRDSAGVTVVVNDPIGLGEPDYWGVGSVALRLGEADGTGPEVFHRVVGALYDGDEIIVADGGSGELRWFDSTGQHLATAGGAGG